MARKTVKNSSSDLPLGLYQNVLIVAVIPKELGTLYRIRKPDLTQFWQPHEYQALEPRAVGKPLKDVGECLYLIVTKEQIECLTHP